MTSREFFQQLDACVAKYDLLCHPFYKAWSAGELTREDLQEYACDYYHHVEAFPTFLAELGIRLEESELRRAVLANMSEEKGGDDLYGEPSPAHSELWLDFAEGMGASRNMRGYTPLPAIKRLVSFYHRAARKGTPEEALAAFYVYESQVPRVAQEKARGLEHLYGTDDKTRRYFSLHATADVHHARVWRQQLAKRLESNPQGAEAALESGEAAARALWEALDGINERRMARAA
jgi:pyrroloquinoline-quinone synthase